jgi:hypothetical protein
MIPESNKIFLITKNKLFMEALDHTIKKRTNSDTQPEQFAKMKREFVLFPFRPLFIIKKKESINN